MHLYTKENLVDAAEGSEAEADSENETNNEDVEDSEDVTDETLAVEDNSPS